MKLTLGLYFAVGRKSLFLGQIMCHSIFGLCARGLMKLTKVAFSLLHLPEFYECIFEGARGDQWEPVR